MKPSSCRLSICSRLIEGWKEKSVDNLLGSIEAKREPDGPRFLFGLGIPGVGLVGARGLAQVMPTTADGIAAHGHREVLYLEIGDRSPGDAWHRMRCWRGRHDMGGGHTMQLGSAVVFIAERDVARVLEPYGDGTYHGKLLKRTRKACAAIGGHMARTIFDSADRAGFRSHRRGVSQWRP